MILQWQLPVFLALCLLGITLELAASYPFSIITSGKPYCRTWESAKDTDIRVEFEAPDVVLEGEGATGPTYITITEKPSLSALEVIEEEEGTTPKKARKVVPVTPLSHEIRLPKGHFDYRVKNDAELSICIRASSAGSKRPMRFAIEVDEYEEAEAEDEARPPTEAVDSHLSFMEEQFVRIENQMHTVLREADFAKERDSIYHTKTDAMHKATIFWPIVHVGILLVTGFTQANHIVQFFKKRRII